jgi:hypothetical protein
MALRPDRDEHLTDLSFFMNEVSERGVVVCYTSQGSGAAMDDSTAVVALPANASEAAAKHPAGLLLNDVVNLDLTKQHINFDKDEVQKGNKVLLLRRGFVVTNMISGTPVFGEQAYMATDGNIVTSSQYSGGTVVGRFLSTKDADGYAKVDINIV